MARPKLPHSLLRDVRFTPHYPAKSPLDEIFVCAPGTDEYIVEGHAAELMALLEKWSEQLRIECPASAVVSSFVDPAVQSTALTAIHEYSQRPGTDRSDPREFSSSLLSGRENSFSN